MNRESRKTKVLSFTESDGSWEVEFLVLYDDNTVEGKYLEGLSGHGDPFLLTIDKFDLKSGELSGEMECRLICRLEAAQWLVSWNRVPPAEMLSSLSTDQLADKPQERRITTDLLSKLDPLVSELVLWRKPSEIANHLGIENPNVREGLRKFLERKRQRDTDPNGAITGKYARKRNAKEWEYNCKSAVVREMIREFLRSQT